MDLEARENENFNFDFKPLNEGLGFHRKVKPLEAEADPEDSFSFSAIGAGNLDVTSREQSKGLLTSGTQTASLNSTLSNSSALGGSASVANAAKTKHNAKSVSDLIAALPPSLDLLLDERAAATSASNSGSGAAAPSGSRSRRSPLFGPPSDEFAKPGSPAAASMNAGLNASTTEEKASGKRGFLKLPLGRNDYGIKSKAASTPGSSVPSSLDENVAKTFPSVFPHLGSLAGQPAAAGMKATLKSGSTATSSKAAQTAEVRQEVVREYAISAHFGSAILDTLVSIGIACLLLAIALSITGANLLALLENSATDEAMMTSLAAFFVGSGLLYVLAARTWVGATLGEWSYEVRVGTEGRRSRWFYPVLILWRGFVVAATGFVVLPMISMIVGTDLLKYLTGLQLVSMNASPDVSIEGSLVAENPA
jgi:hypothetical protein